LPLSEHDLRRALERIGVDAPVRFDEVTRSTQLTARDMADEGAPEWTLVAAGHQTEGRGRLGRTWVDAPGEALAFSLILRPAIEAEHGGLITLLAGWALATACRDVAGVVAGCRWPNDLVVGDGKAGGILAESVVDGGRIGVVILGVGVNLSRAPDVPGATALGDVDAAALLGSFLRGFADRYRPGDPDFAPGVVGAYRDVCITLETRVRAVTTDGTTTEGEAIDIDEAGGLIVRTDHGVDVARFGEVRQLR
jgi:BirA family transcriptional regulator, biotin operon repressor / biotin---[acetyl-CoA-carboxylase] ligase